jgi:hypothetical protein
VGGRDSNHPTARLARRRGLVHGWRDGMTSEQRSAVGRRLLALREALLGRGPSEIEPNRRDEAATGGADEDAQALSEMHQVLASQRNAGQADVLVRITRAIDRLAGDPPAPLACDSPQGSRLMTGFTEGDGLDAPSRRLVGGKGN